MDDFPIDEERWPTKVEIEELLKEIVGTRCRLTGISALRKRSLFLETADQGARFRFAAHKQRSNNTLRNLPLSEEAAVLTYLATQLPGRSIRPLYFTPSLGYTKQPFLITEWREGTLLADLISLKEKPEEIRCILERELCVFHQAGYMSEPPKLSRVVLLDDFVQRARSWDPNRLQVGTERWVRFLSSFEQLRHSIPMTLLHGDAHAYNLLHDGSDHFWIDLEYAVIGPPELDHARVLALLAVQLNHSLDIGSAETSLQLAFNVFVSAGLLQTAGPNTSRKAIEALQTMCEQSLMLLYSTID